MGIDLIAMTPLRLAVTLVLLVACAATDPENAGSPSEIYGHVGPLTGQKTAHAEPSVNPLEPGEKSDGPEEAREPGSVDDPNSAPTQTESVVEQPADAHESTHESSPVSDENESTHESNPVSVLPVNEPAVNPPMSQSTESMANEELPRTEDADAHESTHESNPVSDEPPASEDHQSMLPVDEPAVTPMSQPTESMANEQLSKTEDVQSLDAVDPAKDATLVGRPDYALLNKKMEVAKRQRLVNDATVAADHARTTKAEADVDNRRLDASHTKLEKLHGKAAQLASTHSEAQKAALVTEKHIHELHHNVAEAAGVLAIAKRAEEEAKGSENAHVVQQAMQDAEAGAGGGDEDDSEKHSAERRKFQDEEYAESVNSTITAHALVVEKEKEASVLQNSFDNLEEERVNLNDQLYQEDHKMAGANYDAEELVRETNAAEEELAQSQAVTTLADKRALVAKNEAEAALDAKDRNTDGLDKEAMAEAMDPELRQEHIVNRVMDQDGLGDAGQDLVTKPGVVSAAYVKAWNSIQVPTSNNPLLNAAAAAAVNTPAV